MKLWKQLIALALLLLVVDGGLRKWVLPSQSLVLFVLKDVVLWGGYFLYAWECNPFELPRPLRNTWVSPLLAGYAFIVLAQAFNPRQPALIVGLLGLKYHLAFVPLAVMLPRVIAEVTERQFERGLWAYSLLIYLPVVILGIYQFFQPKTAWVNQYVGGTDPERIAGVAGHPRITATFSYIGSFTPYLTFSTFLSVGVLLAGFQWGRRGLKVLGTILCVATVIVSPMTGSRSMVVIPAIVLAVLFLVMKAKGKWIRVLGVVAIGILALGRIGGGLALEGWSALGERVAETGTGEGGRRVLNVLQTPVEGLEKAGLFGYGVGTNQNSAPRLTTRSDWPGRYSGDRGDLRLIMELGFLGWLVLTALKAALLYIAVQTLRGSRSPMEFIIAATAFCKLLINLVLPVAFNVVDGALYWTSAGCVIGIWSRQQVLRTVSAPRGEGSVRG
jgi:hypothetical protein